MPHYTRKIQSSLGLDNPTEPNFITYLSITTLLSYILLLLSISITTKNMKNKTNTILTRTFLAGIMLIPLNMMPYTHAIEGDLILTVNNPTPDYNDRFGSTIAVTSDKNMLVGSSNTGSAYLFDKSGTLLLTINNPNTEQHYDLFGQTVATTSDGNLLIGDTGSDNAGGDTGSVYLFNGTTDNRMLTIDNPTATSHDFIGSEISYTPNGDIVVGAWQNRVNGTISGGIYLFNGTTGSLLLTIDNPDPNTYAYFGSEIAVTSDGNIVAGGSLDPNSNYPNQVYLFDGTTGSLLLTIDNPDPNTYAYFGRTVATTSDGNILATAGQGTVNGIHQGSIHLFDGATGELLLTINNSALTVDGLSKTIPTGITNDDPNYFFDEITGEHLLRVDAQSLVPTGSRNIPLATTYFDDVIAGSSYENSVYIFDGTTGELVHTITTPVSVMNGSFGMSVKTIHNDVLVGSPFDNTGADWTGSTYLFEGRELFCGQLESSYNRIDGTENSDILVGTDSADLIFGYGGDDLITGKDGNDCLYGGNGADLIKSGGGNDTIYGGGGSDYIKLGSGTNSAYGEAGVDILYSRSGGDSLDGGSGSPRDVCVSTSVETTLVNCEVIDKP